MSGPRILAALAALYVTIQLPLPVTAHSAHAASLHPPHPDRAIAGSHDRLTSDDVRSFTILEARADDDDGDDGSYPQSGDPFDPSVPHRSVDLSDIPYPEDILPPPTTWPPGPTFPAKTPASDDAIATSVPISSGAPGYVAATSVVAETTAPAITLPSSAVTPPINPVTPSQNGRSTAPVSSEEPQKSTPPVPLPSSAHAWHHHNCSSSAGATAPGGRLVPTSMAGGLVMTTAVKSTAPAAATPSSLTAGSAGVAGVPEGLLGALVVGVGFWAL